MTLNSPLHKNLASIFNSCQESTASHSKLLQKCQQLYKESNFDDFFPTFTMIMENIMITMVKNPNIDRAIDFIAKFSVSLSTSSTSNPLSTNQLERTNNNTNTTVILQQQQTTVNSTTINNNNNNTTAANTTTATTDEIENVFLVALINYFLNNHRANSDAVRYRCCHILSKIMSAINNEQFIDEELFDKLCDAMLERLKDINSKVQVQAVAAIYRLQDPNDRNCRVIKALLFLMTYDPHWQVRYQALSHIAFSKQTLPNIIDRVRDLHPNIRRKALLILSEKVLIKFISIEKRLFILNYSLKDQEAIVLETCCKKLLPSWLAFKENNIIKLLKALDVVEATETIELMLDKMYSEDDLSILCKDFNLINEKHVIDYDKLDAESVTYWKWLCEKCKKNEDDESLDLILPSLTEFCDYVKKAFDKLNNEANDTSDVRRRCENYFVIKQLVKMFPYLDFSDLHGMKTLSNLCHDLFSNKSNSYLFDSVMSVYKLAVPNLQQRINNLVELISDLRDPTSAINVTESVAQIEAAQTPSIHGLFMTPTPSTPRFTPRELSFKISELKFQKFKLKDEFDKIYKEMTTNVAKTVDMNLLADLREQMKKVEDEIADLQAQLTNTEKIELAPTNTNDNQKQQQQQQQQQQKQKDRLDASFDLDNIYHCLQLSVCLLEDTEIKTLTPQLRELCDSLILPNISSVTEDIRAIAVRALNLICILKLDIAQKYVPLFLEMIQRDKKDIIIEAFKAVINCIMAYSLNKLVSHLDDAENTKTEATTKIISAMTSLLDSEDSDMYTCAVEGFCKLFMTGHIISAKLFSKLLIMYYSPLTENDKKLRACLACFLPQFAFMRSTNQLCVEESFMITIKCLINASPDSYLSEIDLIKVTEILLHLTNPKNLLRKPNQRQVINNTCHENIGKAICFEILHDDNAFKFRTYLKILNMIDLSLADYYSLKELKLLAVKVEEHITDRLLKKSAKKFTETIDELITKMPEYEREMNRLGVVGNINQQVDTTNNKNVTEQILANSQSSNESDNEEAEDTQVKESSLNSSEMIDTDFKRLTKKAKSGHNKNSTMINTTKFGDVSKALANECSVRLTRINETAIKVVKKLTGATAAAAVNTSKRAFEESTMNNKTINETRSRKSSLSVSKALDETNDQTLTETPTKRLTRASLRSSNTPKSADKSILKRVLTPDKQQQQQNPSNKIKNHARNILSKENTDSGSEIEVISIILPDKKKNKSKMRTQSESPCTSVEYEPPSKLRKSTRIQSANTRTTRTSRSAHRTSK